MTKRKRAQRIRPEDMIAWVWEEDDPAAAPCDSRHLDIDDQSIEPHNLRVYDSLLACGLDTDSGEPAPVADRLDTTLANILVFADDCRAAAEWLTEEAVSFEDEKGRRFGQRRRHLKERGFLTNSKRFVRICGEVVDDDTLVIAMAARHCIDHWHERWGEKALHFRKDEDGVRWEPCSHETELTTTMTVSNPFTAPPTEAEADGCEVLQYDLEAGHDGITAVRLTGTTPETESPDGDPDERRPRWVWVLNDRAQKTVEWLLDAAETVADMARTRDKHALQTLFPSLQETRRRERQQEKAKEAARKTRQGPQDQSVH